MLPPTSTSSNAAASSNATLINGRLSAPGVGVWTEEESKRFRAAMELYPTGPWSAVAAYVGTRTVRQTMTHAQKCRQRLDRHARGLKPAGRKRRASQSDGHNDTQEPSLSGTFEIVELAELQSSSTPLEPIDPSNFDWVLQYLTSPDWVDIDLSDEDLMESKSLDLVELGP